VSEVAGNRKLLLAYSSYRPRGRGLNIYFYEHDGQRAGKHVGQVEVDADGSMLRPSLSADGTLCAFAYQSYEASNGSAIRLWSVANKEYLILDGIASPVPQMQPAISGDGRWIAFSAWQRPGGSGGWDVHLYDRAKGTLTPLPGLNTEFDELSPSISFDGGLVAFVSDRPTGEDGRARRQRVYVYERATRRTVNLPGLGADAGTWRDWDPALSGDGRFLAFTSDRPGPGGLFVGYSSV
jgi:Tol biopolymer transport system component